MFVIATLSVGFTACGNDDDDNEPKSTNNTQDNSSEESSDQNTNTSKHEYVDLGLPSGTLWATTNVGADKPEEYGDYFAWGETSPKEEYDWYNYKWCNDSPESFTKYNASNTIGYVDNKSELDLEDDAAYVNWGKDWKIPSTEQQQELSNQCIWKWTQVNGVYGYEVKGTNGNKIFLPAAGYFDGSSVKWAGSSGYYSSRNIFGGTMYDIINFSRSGVGGEGSAIAIIRCAGASIRPVRIK